MALSATNTPKKINAARRKGNVDICGFVTPKTQMTTPKKILKTPLTSGTPECFNKVLIETPGFSKNRIRTSQEKEKGDEISNLTVAVRIRPMNARELAHVGAANIVKVENDVLFVKSNPVGNSGLFIDHSFQYDHIFLSCDESTESYSTQDKVFSTLGLPLINSALKGYNACLFAYGQTGSGKSFSMMGRSENDIDSGEYSGIIPRFCRSIFTRLKELPDNCSATLDVSYFEIYNEKIHDLLSHDSLNKIPLKVREHPTCGPYVENLSVNTVKTYNELRNWLLIGNKNRATAATSMNEKSSRSHSIFTIEISLTNGLDENTDGSGRRSRINLVDLAGSERLSNSSISEEKEKIRQGVSINKSLLTLGKVISSLADQRKNQFVPYRDSVLTWLLRESLGGNSMTTMLATITPSNLHVDETLSTLRYACQARSIVNRARINENPHEKLIRELRSEVLRLRSLKQNYERTSIGSNCSSISNISSISGIEELEDLRHKLNETENKLNEAEKSWQQKFSENTSSQLKRLEEIERQKEELESKVRVMENVDQNLSVSPYKSNFFEELEGVLKEGILNIEECHNFDIIIVWCKENFLNYSISRNALLLTDYKNNKQTIITLSDLDQLNKYSNVNQFLNNLTWNVTKSNKKLTKSEILKSMNTIYQNLSNILPPEDNQNLNLIYAKISKSLQKYESALIDDLSSKNEPKTVKFKL